MLCHFIIYIFILEAFQVNLFRIKSVKIFDKIPLGGLRFINLETSLISIPEINDLKQLKSAQMIWKQKQCILLSVGNFKTNLTSRQWVMYLDNLSSLKRKLQFNF